MINSIETPDRHLEVRPGSSENVREVLDLAREGLSDHASPLTASKMEWLITDDGQFNLVRETYAPQDKRWVWPAPVDQLARSIPVWTKNDCHCYTKDFVFVGRFGSGKPGDWLVSQLNSGHPWIAEHVLPAIRMRQMTQVAAMAATSGIDLGDPLMVQARLLAGQEDLPTNYPRKLAERPRAARHSL